MAIGCAADDEELIERAKALQERAKGWDGHAVARQQAQDVRVERDPAEADPREGNQQQRAPDHRQAAAVGPRHDRLDG